MPRLLPLLAGLLASCLAGGAQAAGPAKKLNVLFLFTDDQRADAIGALDNPHVKTPNLDKLVQTGFTFRNAYCLGSNVPAVCTPSRNIVGRSTRLPTASARRGACSPTDAEPYSGGRQSSIWRTGEFNSLPNACASGTRAFPALPPAWATNPKRHSIAHSSA